MNRTSFSNANNSPSTLLKVRYFVELVDYSWYRVTRTASKRYEFVGMTRETANDCRAAKVAQYTRKHYSIVEGTRDEGLNLPFEKTAVSCMANITVSHSHSSAWVCSIDVNEVDVKAVRTPPADPATLFADLNEYDYDEDSELWIDDCYYWPRSSSAEFYIAYGCSSEISERNRITVEAKSSPTDETWTPFASRDTTDEGVRVKLVTSWDLPRATAQFRLRYGGIVSAPHGARARG